MNDLFINIITHPTFSVITFLTGVLLGNHFAVGRDRRKEFNDAAEKLSTLLHKEKTALFINNTLTIGPGDNNFRRFREHLLWWRGIRFHWCLKKYKEAKSKQNQTTPNIYNEIFYHDISPIIKQIDKLLKFTKRK